MLTVVQKQHFDEHGWTVVRQVLPPDRVAILLAALDAMIPEAAYARGWAGRVVEVPAISRGSAELLSHARDPELAKLGAAVLGARRLRLLQDTALVKPGAGGGRVEWHQDYSYFAFLDEPRVVTLRLALTACTRDNGCLRAIHGSHRWGLQGSDLSFRARTVDDALEALPAPLREAARSGEELVELEAGDVSIHHCLTFHSSAENPTARPRKTLAVRLVDADCKVNTARFPSPELANHFTTDADGRLAGDLFPLVFDGSAD